MVVDRHNVLQPDVIVAVEVLSSSTSSRDRVVKARTAADAVSGTGEERIRTAALLRLDLTPGDIFAT